jgi:uncharacterized protein (DUF58 family)
VNRLAGLRAALGRSRAARGAATPPGRAGRGDAIVDGPLLQTLDRLSIGLGRDLVAGLMGEHRAARRMPGSEFADYRPYVSGDDLRRVDWNAYARLGTLQIKQSQTEHDTVLHLLVDASPSMAFGTPSKFLAARRLAAALGYIALAHLDAVVLSTPGGRTRAGAAAEAAAGLDPVRSRAAAGTLFRALHDLQPATVSGFDGILAGWTTEATPGRPVVLLSDLLLDDYQAGVRRLVAAGFQVTILHILSPDELHPAAEGDLQLIDSETGEQLEIRLDRESRAAYGRQLAAWRAEVAEWCRLQGVTYILVPSDWDVERALLELLRHGRVTA